MSFFVKWFWVMFLVLFEDPMNESDCKPRQPKKDFFSDYDQW